MHTILKSVCTAHPTKKGEVMASDAQNIRLRSKDYLLRRSLIGAAGRCDKQSQFITDQRPKTQVRR